MGRSGSSEVGGQAHAVGALSSLSTPGGLDACDRTFSVAPVGTVINASLYTLGSAVSSLSEVSSAPAAVSSSSMDTGQQQAEGALSITPSTPFQNGQDQADQGRSERGVLCTRVIEDAEMRRSSLFLMANPVSAPDNNSACNISVLNIRSTEQSAAASSATAAPAGCRGDRHTPSPVFPLRPSPRRGGGDRGERKRRGRPTAPPRGPVQLSDWQEVQANL